MLKSSSVFIERLHTLSSCEFAPNSIAQNTLRNPARMLHWAVTSAEEGEARWAKVFKRG